MILRREIKSKRNPNGTNCLFRRYREGGQVELSIAPMLYLNPSTKYGTHLRSIDLNPFSKEWYNREVQQMGYSQFDVLLGDVNDNNLLEISDRFNQFWLTKKLVHQDTDSNANLVMGKGHAVIEDIAEDTDLVFDYRVKRYRLSTRIRLKSKDAIRSQYAISVLPSNNLTLSIESQAIKVLNTSNNDYFYIKAPVIEVYKNEFITGVYSGSDYIYYTIENETINGQAVKVVYKNLTQACVTQLNSAFDNGADYIDIDPEETMQPSAAAGIDTSILKEDSNYVDTNFGSDATFYLCNRYPDMQKWYAGLIKFSDLTNFSNITTATLSIFQKAQNNSYNYTWTGYVYRLLVDFVESEATWNIRKTGTSWGTAGALGTGDINSTSIGSWTGNQAYAVGTEKEISLNATTVNNMAEGTYDNEGFKLLPESGGNYSTYYATSDHTTDHPKLVIECTSSSTYTPAKKIVEFDVISAKPDTTVEIKTPSEDSMISGEVDMKIKVNHHKSSDPLTVTTYYKEYGGSAFTQIDSTSNVKDEVESNITHTWNTNSLLASFYNSCQLKVNAKNASETINVNHVIDVVINNKPQVVQDIILLDENFVEITDRVIRSYLSTEDNHVYFKFEAPADVGNNDQIFEVDQISTSNNLTSNDASDYTSFYKWNGSSFAQFSSASESIKTGDIVAVKIPLSWSLEDDDISITVVQ